MAYNLHMAAAVGQLEPVQAYFLPDGRLRNDANAQAHLEDVPDQPTFDDPKAVIQHAFRVAVLHGRTGSTGFSGAGEYRPRRQGRRKRPI